MEELKRCPICGGEVVIDEIGDLDDGRYKIRCYECGLEMASHGNKLLAHYKNELVCRWNARKTDERLIKRVSDMFFDYAKVQGGWIDEQGEINQTVKGSSVVSLAQIDGARCIATRVLAYLDKRNRYIEGERK